MRLIDADLENEKLLDFIAQNDSAIQYAIEHKDMTILEDIFFEYFEAQKTAYDVDFHVSVTLAHHIRDGMIQPLAKDAEVKGYDASGIAEYLYTSLRNHFPIDEMLEEYDDTKERFIEEIEYALDDIGF